MCYPFSVPRAFLAFFALAVALSLAACRHPTGEQCEALCWRYNELHYWERFEKDAQGLTAGAREGLRAERQAAWDDMKKRGFDPGLENCVRECRRSASPDAPACIEKSRTTAQADRCRD